MTEIENGTIEMFDYSLDDINYTSNPNFENLPAGIYSVYLKDDLECITAFQVTVDEIIVEEINELVYIPNIFNPQSFKGNDCFKAYVSSDVVINQFHLEIYDRWGSKVFESDDIDNCWNGKFKDDPLELGVYCYILSLDYTECNEPKNTLFYGDITLIR